MEIELTVGHVRDLLTVKEQYRIVHNFLCANYKDNKEAKQSLITLKKQLSEGVSFNLNDIKGGKIGADEYVKVLRRHANGKAVVNHVIKSTVEELLEPTTLDGGITWRGVKEENTNEFKPI